MLINRSFKVHQWRKKKHERDLGTKKNEQDLYHAKQGLFCYFFLAKKRANFLLFCVERSHLLENQVMTKNKLFFDRNKSQESLREKENKVKKKRIQKKKSILLITNYPPGFNLWNFLQIQNKANVILGIF